MARPRASTAVVYWSYPEAVPTVGPPLLLRQPLAAAYLVRERRQFGVAESRLINSRAVAGTRRRAQALSARPDFEAHDWSRRTVQFNEPTWFGLPGDPARQRVIALGADVMVSTDVETIVINGSDLAVLIVKDALSDRAVWYRR